MHEFKNKAELPEVLQDILTIIGEDGHDYGSFPVLVGIVDIKVGNEGEDLDLSETICRWQILLSPFSDDPVLFPVLVHGEPDARFEGSLRE